MKRTMLLGIGILFLSSACGSSMKGGETAENPGAPAKTSGPAMVTLQAFVVHPVVALDATSFSLVTPGGEVAATSAKTFADAGKTVAMVILVQGDERWMGNETYRDSNDPDQIVGAFSSLPPVIDVLAGGLPIGSQATVMTYAGSKSEVRYPMGDAAKLHGTVLGTQKDYKDIGIPFVPAVTEALRVLSATKADRRVVVVLGSGSANAADVQKPLALVVNKMRSAGIDSYSIRFSATPENGEDRKAQEHNMNVVGYTGTHVAVSGGSLPGYARHISQSAASGYLISFQVPASAAADASTLAVKVNGESLPFAAAPAVIRFGASTQRVPAARQADPDADDGTDSQGGVLGGMGDDAPPPPPPPSAPLIVPMVALEQQRLAGVKTIVPDTDVRTAMSRAGQKKIVSAFKMCLSDAGVVETVDVLKSSGHPGYDQHIRSTILGTWRYRPFVVNSRRVPVCTSVTFIYNRSP